MKNSKFKNTIKKLFAICLSILSTFTICSSSLAVTAEAAAYKSGEYVIAEKQGVYIRKQPNVSSQKLGAIPNNTKITVTSISGSWGKTVYNKKTGWVCLDYAKYSPAKDLGVYKITAREGLNIRNSASSSGKKLGAIPYNTKVTVTSVKNGWGYVKYGKVSGWICLDYATKVSNTNTTTTTTIKPTQTTVNKFVNPLSSKYKTNIVTQSFRNYYKGNGYHLGVDLGTSGNKSTNVVAIANGVVYRVLKTSESSGYGNLVIVKHVLENGKVLYSAYGHLASVSVKEGAEVSAGTKLGVRGSTGYSTGPHLHLAVYNGNVSKSTLPKGYLSKNFSGDSYTVSNITYYNPMKVISTNGSIIK